MAASNMKQRSNKWKWTFRLLIITVIVGGGYRFLFLERVRFNDPPSGPHRFTVNMEDASNETVNDTAGMNNVLATFELVAEWSTIPFDLDRMSWMYRIGTKEGFFSVVDNGTCGSAWNFSRQSGDLYNGGWDPLTVCLFNGDGDGIFEPGEFFYVLENEFKAPVSDQDGILLSAFWDNLDWFLEDAKVEAN